MFNLHLDRNSSVWRWFSWTKTRRRCWWKF